MKFWKCHYKVPENILKIIPHRDGVCVPKETTSLHTIPSLCEVCKNNHSY